MSLMGSSHSQYPPYIDVGEVGQKGPRGDKGPQGDPGPGGQTVFFGETEPTAPGPWVWYKTEDGVLIDIVVEATNA